MATMKRAHRGTATTPASVVRYALAHPLGRAAFRATSRVAAPIRRQVHRRQGPDAVRNRLLDVVLRNRTWSLHRHVHLVAAFDEVRSRGPVRNALAAGCGNGFTELYLAACHPDTEFTLTDIDPARMRVARRIVANYGLRNVRFEILDLLAPPPATGPYDFVSSIEVLEHIDDDSTAAANLVALSRDWLYIVVPFCSADALVDDDRIRGAWERHEHVRPGYTATTLGDLVAGTTVEWVRNCYFKPEATDLRRRLQDASDAELERDRDALVAEAALDRRDELTTPAGAYGIEVLTRVGAPDASSTAPPQT